MPDPQQIALGRLADPGYRSLMSGDTEAGPSYLDQLVRQMTDMATIRPSPTGSRLENLGQLLPYFMPAAEAGSAAVRALTSRLRGAPAAAEAAAPAASVSRELNMNPAFGEPKMPPVVKVEPPPTMAPRAPGFEVGKPLPWEDVPISKSKRPPGPPSTPSGELTKNLQARTTGPVPDVTGSQQRTINALLNSGMNDKAIQMYLSGGGR